MAAGKRKPDARRGYRWLAGVSALVSFWVAVVCVYPPVVGGDEDPNPELAVLLLCGAFLFAMIALAGSMPKGEAAQRQLLAAAKRYVSGRMSLEEYGALTKRLLEEE